MTTETTSMYWRQASLYGLLAQHYTDHRDSDRARHYAELHRHALAQLAASVERQEEASATRAAPVHRPAEEYPGIGNPYAAASSHAARAMARGGPWPA
ncbi:hypothetical protein IDH44_24935, partial [Paenibacillus sp. IB182496]